MSAKFLFRNGGAPRRAWQTARGAVVLLLVLSTAFVPTGTAKALSFTVNTAADTVDAALNGVCADASGNCSLRAAVMEANANPGSTITFAASLNGTPIILTRTGNDQTSNAGDLDINASTTITGNGPANTIIQGAADASYTGSIGDKIFGVNQTGTYNSLTVSFSGMTVRYGDNTVAYNDGSWAQTGAGIDIYQSGPGNSASLTNMVIAYNRNHNSYGGGLNFDQTYGGTGSLTIDNVTFQGNRTLGETGNLWQGGGARLIGKSPTIAISNSAFLDNATPSTGTGSAGGAIQFYPYLGGSLTISNTIFTNNTSRQGGAISVYSLAAATTVTIQNSLFTGNTASGAGGGLYLDNPSLNTTPFQLTELEINGNTAGTSGGGVHVGGSNVSLAYSRIVNNTSSTGADVYKDDPSFTPEGTLTAIRNWWGCSTGPGGTGCDTAGVEPGESAVYDPWLRDLLTPSAGTTLVTNQSSTLTATFLTDSSNTAVALADLSRIIGLPIAWNASSGSASGDAVVNAAGTALGTFQAAGVGSAIVYARVDNDNTLPVSSNVLTFTVNPANTTTAIVSDLPDPSAPGQPVTVMFTVTGSYGNLPTAPTGNVTVTDGVDSCTDTVAAGSCDLTFATSGAKTITATYAGDANFNGSTSSGVAHTVQPYPTTTAITGDTPDSSLVGQAVTVSFTVTSAWPGTPTGDVTVSDGADTCTGALAAGSGSCSLTLTTAGSRTLTATYTGDLAFQGSTSAGEPHTVNAAGTTTTVTLDDPDPSVVGQAVTVNFTVTSVWPGTPTGNVTVSDGADSCTGALVAGSGSCSLTLTTAGSRTLTGTYAGDLTFQGSVSAGEAHTVNPTDTTTTITSDAPDSSQVGQTVTINFTVTAVPPGTGTPTGSVTVSDGADSCTGTVAAGACTIAFSSAGSKTLTAVYAGDGNFNASTSGPAGHTVSPASTTISILSDAPDPSVVGIPVPVTFAVTVMAPGSGTPTGSVTITDGVDHCTVAVAVGTCNLTMTTSGGRLLTASYSGDANYGGSVSIPVDHWVQGPPAVTRINSSADTGDGQILENEHTTAAITQLLVVFNKDMNADTPGDLNDALTVANYSLVQAGATVIPINPVITYDAGTRTATLAVAALPDGEYTLTVLGRIEDTLGVPLGTDFVRHFSVDNGHPHHISIATLPNRRAITNGATLNVSFSSIDIAFDEDLGNAGGGAGLDDVTNPLNYLLLQAGPNAAYDTTSCQAFAANGDLPLSDDIRIPTGPVTYDNHGGAGPFVATVQLNGGTALPNGIYRLYICGTTSIVDLAGNPLNGDAGPDSQVTFTVLMLGNAGNPNTGFAPGVVSLLPDQPAEKAYASLGGLWIEIPKLNLKTGITGVPLTSDGWDVTWLYDQVGWLSGTAYPTWEGNSALTAHAYTADGLPGPFANLKNLAYGDAILIHLDGMRYTYEVRSNLRAWSDNTTWITRHEEYPWLTLITCQQYDEASGQYRYRRIVRAVLIGAQADR